MWSALSADWETVLLRRSNYWQRLVVVVFLWLLLGTLAAQETPPVLLPNEGVTVLGPDDTLELVLRLPAGAPAGPDAASLKVRAWIVAGDAADPAPDLSAHGRALVFAAPSRPGEWLVHLRGLKAPAATPKSWDLFLRWGSGGADEQTARLKQAVAFRAGQPDVVLLLDGSLSMGRTDPQRMRVEAARAFTRLARESGGVGRVALVQFDDNVRTILPLTPLPEAAAIERGLEQIGENGQTDIDGGLRSALEVLKGGAAQASGAIVLLTDGKQEPGEYRDAHKLARGAGVPVHAVALGRDADRRLLQRIASETGGMFAEAGFDQDLLRLYASIAGKIAGGRTILRANLAGAGETAYPVDGACRTLTVAAAAPQGGALTVRGPQGFEAATGAQAHPLFFLMTPASGAWTSAWQPQGAGTAQLDAGAQTALYPLFFRARAGATGGVELDPDEPVLAVSLAEGTDLLPAEIDVKFESAEGARFAVQDAKLFDDGKHGDGAAGDGVFAGGVSELRELAPADGTSGTATARVQGTRANGEMFRREAQTVWTIRRSGVRGLAGAGLLDLGQVWSGSVASGTASVRVRGPGGAIKVDLAAAQAAGLPADALEVTDAPERLEAGSRGQLAVRLRIPEGTPAGIYSGRLRVSLVGADDAGALELPWRVQVRPAVLTVTPARLDLGQVLPGQRLQRKITLATLGGRMNLAPAVFANAAWFTQRRDARKHLLPGAGCLLDLASPVAAGLMPVDAEGYELTLDLVIPESAPAGRSERQLILRDRLGREAARLVVMARVQSMRLEVSEAFDFGALEPGDEQDLPVRCSLVGTREIAGLAGLDLDVRAWPDHAPVLETAWLAGAGGGQARVKAGPRAVPGAEGGWLAFRAGPVLALRRWETRIVAPVLRASSDALDLGVLLPGQARVKSMLVSFEGARPTDVAVAIAAPPAKPRLKHIALPSASLQARAAQPRLAPGETGDVDLELQVPETAQDGSYETRLVLESRLGKLDVPVRFRVAAPVAHPPFHVRPAAVTLKVVDQNPASSVEIVITSHVDDDLLLATRLLPGEAAARMPADLLATREGTPTQAQAVMLPGRGELRLYLRAWPDAETGETGRLALEGAGESQSVQLAIESVRTAHGLGGVRPAVESFFDWLRLLLFLLLVLLILLVRALAKKRWVRYAAYASAFHAALMLLAVPAASIVGALPDQVQLSLLVTQDELGFELSPEQERRLEALRTGSETLEGAQAAQESGALGGGEAAQLPEAHALAAAPAAAGELARVDTPDPRKPAAKAAAAPERIALTEEADVALLTEAPAVPAPQPHQAEPVAVNAAPADTPLEAVQPPAASLPDAKPVARVPVSEALVKLTEAAPVVPARNSAVPSVETLSERSTRDAPAEADLPLLVEAPAVKPTAKAPPQAAAVEPVVRREPAAVLESSAEHAAPLASLAEPHATRPLTAVKSASAVQAAIALQEIRAGRDSVVGSGVKGSREISSRSAGRSNAQAVSGDTEGDALAAGTAPTGSGKAAVKTTGSGLGAAEQGPERGALSGTGLVALGEGRSGQGQGLDALGAGTQVFGKPGAHGSRLGLEGSTGMGGAGSERSGAESRAGTNQGTGRSTNMGAGDAPLLAAGTGKGAAGKGAGNAGRGPVEGEGRAKAAGIGLGLMGTGPGSGEGTLAALGHGAGANAPANRPQARGGSATGFEPATLVSAWKPAERLSGKGTGTGGERPVWGPAQGAVLRVTLGLARHKGDWNSSPTALHHLATAFKERCGLPDVVTEVKTVGLSDTQGLAACRMVLITSNDPVVFSAAEREGLRAYVAQGGLVWVNDSSAGGDERFDTGFRIELAACFPNARLERLDVAHPLFRTAYDLSRGYKGYRLPPGDKYRAEFIEALAPAAANQRTGLIYTRNDYADGLEIDPRNIAGRLSLTDLSAEEMLEGSLRMGINLIAYGLGAEAPSLPPPPESAAQAVKLYRYQGPELPVADGFDEQVEGEPVWKIEDWGNPASVAVAQTDKGAALKVAFRKGEKFKAAVARNVELDLASAKSLVLDLHSALPHGFNVALLFQTRPDWAGFESRPVFVRPGWNRNLRFPLDLDDFKSSLKDWKQYDVPFKPRDQTARITILLYNLEADGAVLLDNLRIER